MRFNKNLFISTICRHNDRFLRDAFFMESTELHRAVNGPWRFGGNFNITENFTYYKDNAQCLKDCLAFIDLITSLDLLDLELKGCDYTWSKQREHPSMAHLNMFFFFFKVEKYILYINLDSPYQIGFKSCTNYIEMCCGH